MVFKKKAIMLIFLKEEIKYLKYINYYSGFILMIIEYKM